MFLSAVQVVTNTGMEKLKKKITLPHPKEGFPKTAYPMALVNSGVALCETGSRRVMTQNAQLLSPFDLFSVSISFVFIFQKKQGGTKIEPVLEELLSSFCKKSTIMVCNHVWRMCVCDYIPKFTKVPLISLFKCGHVLFTVCFFYPNAIQYSKCHIYIYINV